MGFPETFKALSDPVRREILVLLSLVLYNDLPEQIAVHWNSADNWDKTHLSISQLIKSFCSMSVEAEKGLLGRRLRNHIHRICLLAVILEVS